MEKGKLRKRMVQMQCSIADIDTGSLYKNNIQDDI